jgi:hypothetical protein
MNSWIAKPTCLDIYLSIDHRVYSASRYAGQQWREWARKTLDRLVDISPKVSITSLAKPFVDLGTYL